MTYEFILTDDPAPQVRRITLNRPEKRNALNNRMRGEIIDALQQADQDRDVRVMVLRGAGTCFSSGYELGGGNEGQALPWFTPSGEGLWPRHVTQGWMSIWELSKPVIAQVHGYCLAGGSELATCCDLVYVADDAQMGYPAVRFGVPDNHFHAWFIGMRKAMEMMLTGDSISGKECARLGWANESVPVEQLEEKVLDVAKRVTGVPLDLSRLNKRLVHRQMEIMGLWTGIRAGSELCALGTHQKSLLEFLAKAREQGLTEALQERDEPFGDYRTRER